MKKNPSTLELKKRRLTRICHTFSLTPSKEQNLMLTPRSPVPPHLALGVMLTSRTVWDLLLYTIILISFSTLIFSNSFSVSLSWSSLVLPMATMKSKKASRPALSPGELLWTYKLRAPMLVFCFLRHLSDTSFFRSKMLFTRKT